jgi:carboxyl-terminal processing protease
MKVPVAARGLSASVLIIIALLSTPAPGQAQVENSADLVRKYATNMLDQIHRDITRTYYDPTFGGVDLEARRELAMRWINAAPSAAESFAAISEYTRGLRDSHTAFYPPMYSDVIDYGFSVRFYGDQAYVTDIRKDGSAERAGLRVGDEVTHFAGTKAERSDFFALWSNKTFIAPVDPLQLTVRAPGAAPRKISVRPEVRPGPTELRSWAVRMRLLEEWKLASRNFRHIYTSVNDSVLLWRMPIFGYKDNNLKKLIDDARKHETLILDLRGNGGGVIETMQKFVGMFFDKEVVIGELRGRKKTEPLLAKPSKAPFTGKLIVLIDSESASSAEVFARVVQLEKRGTVIGDRSAGAVMVSTISDYSVGMDRIWYFGASITVGQLTMRDGGNLEKIGVVPDTLIATTGTDLAAQADPVLAHALGLAGIQMTPAQAGSWMATAK